MANDDPSSKSTIWVCEVVLGMEMVVHEGVLVTSCAELPLDRLVLVLVRKKRSLVTRLRTGTEKAPVNAGAPACWAPKDFSSEMPAAGWSILGLD